MLDNNKDTIVYIPFPVRGNKINEYTTNMVKVLSKKYKMVGDLAEPVDVLQMLKTKAVFLNWVENDLDTKMKCQLFLYRLFGAEVVWIFHNKTPHDTIVEKKISHNIQWLADNSTIIMLHSKSSREYIPNRKKNLKKAVFVPHIEYDSRMEEVNLAEIKQAYQIEDTDFVFTMFGLIRPYKNYEIGIEAFKKLKLENAKLLLAGNPVNSEYAKSIVDLCADNDNIILDFRYIPNMWLDGIIGISDVIVMPYEETSSMNSGVMIQAFSNGKTVITPNICMAKDLAKNRFLYRYKESLEKVMSKAYKNGKELNRQMGIEAKAYMDKNNSEECVESLLFGLLEKRNNRK